MVVGSGGRLGGALVRALSRSHEVMAFDRRGLDLENRELIDDRLWPIRFDLLVNSAALTSVDYCEEHEGEAYRVNAEAPGQMARICSEKGGRMIQLSTDYVYNGREPGLRTEEDPPDPENIYGRSKLEGELRVMAASPCNVVLRTSWVFGQDRPSFIDQIIDRSRGEEGVVAISDKVSVPTYSLDFSEALASQLEHPEFRGVFNLCNSGQCSWREFGQVGLDMVSEMGRRLRTRQLGRQKLAEMTMFKGVRPRHTAMDPSKFSRLVGRSMRAWDDALRAYLAEFY